MSVFAVVLKEPNEQSQAGLRQAYPDSFRLTETVMLVRSALILTEEIAQKAGIKGDHRFTTGVVFKLNRAYSGYFEKTAWEWLQREEDSE